MRSKFLYNFSMIKFYPSPLIKYRSFHINSGLFNMRDI